MNTFDQIPYQDYFNYLVFIIPYFFILKLYSLHYLFNYTCVESGEKVTCVEPPPRSSAATVLPGLCVAKRSNRKFTVNHENIPSSVPSIIEIEFLEI